MSNQSFELLEDVRILNVEETDGLIVADFYGGPGAVCGSIRSARLAPAEVAALRRWALEDTPITLMRRDGRIRFVDEAGLASAMLS
jgi:hypothetical protein